MDFTEMILDDEKREKGSGNATAVIGWPTGSLHETLRLHLPLSLPLPLPLPLSLPLSLTLSVPFIPILVTPYPTPRHLIVSNKMSELRKADSIAVHSVQRFDQFGTVRTESQRQTEARKKGICMWCSIETHKVGNLTKTPLTNKRVYKGICIWHNKDKVPADVYEKWEMEVGPPAPPDGQPRPPNPPIDPPNQSVPNIKRIQKGPNTHSGTTKPQGPQGVETLARILESYPPDVQHKALQQLSSRDSDQSSEQTDRSDGKHSSEFGRSNSKTPFGSDENSPRWDERENRGHGRPPSVVDAPPQLRGPNGLEEKSVVSMITTDPPDRREKMSRFKEISNRSLKDANGNTGMYAGSSKVRSKRAIFRRPGRMPSGKGKMQYHDGSVYDGEWEDGVWSGEGKWILPGGQGVLEGSFTDWKLNGNGSYTYQNEWTVKGRWENELCVDCDAVSGLTTSNYMYLCLWAQHQNSPSAQAFVLSAVAALSDDTTTMLHIETQKNNIKVIKALLSIGFPIDESDSNKQTALHQAVSLGRQGVAEMLLEHGASVDVTDRVGSTPLHIAGGLGRADMAELLLGHGAQIDARMPKGETPLYVASQNGHTDLIDLLTRHGASLDKRLNNGATALYFASQKGNIDVVECLVAKGAFVNAQTEQGASSLYIASQKGHLAVVKCLLNNGADATKATTMTASTPLHIATETGHTEIVEELANSPGLLEVQDKLGWTALHVASKGGQKDMVKLFLRKGASVNAQTDKLQTPLHIASASGEIQVVIALARSGAILDARQSNGYTPVRVAKRKKHQEIVDYLRSFRPTAASGQ